LGITYAWNSPDPVVAAMSSAICADRLIRTYPFTGFSIMNANKCSSGIPVFSGLFDVRLK